MSATETDAERLTRLSAEYTALNDRYNRLLTEHERENRETRAAARKAAWEACVWAAGYLYAATAGPLVYDVLYLIECLPDRPKPADVANLRAATHGLQDKLAQASDKTRLAPLLGEIERLREAVHQQGGALHKALVKERTGEPCWCPGCTLIRAVDLCEREGEAA